MNITVNYQDDLEGDFLACTPGHVAEGLEFLCNVGFPAIGYALLANGLCFLYLGCCHRHHRALRAKRVRDSTFEMESNFTTMTYPKAKATLAFTYMDKLLFALASDALGLAMMSLIYGWGTMYPTTHIRGQLGDAFAVVTFPAVWYLSLLQKRGAAHFKASIQESRASVRNLGEIRTKRRGKRYLVSKVLDTLQSWMAPVIAYLFWMMLRLGLYSRGWFMFALWSAQSVYGLRSFLAILLQRLSTLQKVGHIVTSGRGQYDRLRGINLLVSKFKSILIDLIGVILGSVLAPTSVLFLGSSFNSRQYAIHGFAGGAILAIMFAVSNVQLSILLRRARLRSEMS